ncbi:calcium-permeable channel component Mid1 [Lycorma delicatula]|uniref:calcium-permeable channel component Mid1 n=1 Tax=Lycorma delicatula TaxID=130591 RepID=UPI003F5112ED
MPQAWSGHIPLLAAILLMACRSSSDTPPNTSAKKAATATTTTSTTAPPANSWSFHGGWSASSCDTDMDLLPAGTACSIPVFRPAACAPCSNNNNYNFNNYNNNINNNNKEKNNNTSQCLVYLLDESHKETFCRSITDINNNNNINKNNNNFKYYNNNNNMIKSYRFKHCCDHAVIDTFAPGDLHNFAHCLRHLDAVLALDNTAAQLSCHFAQLLTRYDCGQKYSVRTSCAECQGRSYFVLHAEIMKRNTSNILQVQPVRNISYQDFKTKDSDEKKVDELFSSRRKSINNKTCFFK